MSAETELKLTNVRRYPGVVVRDYAEVKVTEASIQSTLVHALKVSGYTVLEIAKGRSAKAAGLWIGNTVGAPDLFISHPAWPTALWLGMELKTPKGKVRPEQQALADAGRVVIVRGVAEGLAFVQATERGHYTDGNVLAKTRAERLESLIEQFGGTGQ